MRVIQMGTLPGASNIKRKKKTIYKKKKNIENN